MQIIHIIAIALMAKSAEIIQILTDLRSRNAQTGT